MSRQVIEQVSHRFRFLSLANCGRINEAFGAELWRFGTCLSRQVLEANAMRGAVELLDIRPEQLTSLDLGEQQVGLPPWVRGCRSSNPTLR